MANNVMIIDDSPVDRRIIRNVLERRLDGICIFEENDGLDINEKLLSNSINVCILDIMMPFKNGFQVLKEIKEDIRIKDTPVIVCTGIDDKQAIEKALILGAYDYFSKPLGEEAMKISLPLKAKNAIEFMKRNREVSFLSYHDALTGLYNRRFFEEALLRLDTEKNLPISIIIGDVNGLKLINDAFGHNSGDELLKKAANAIKSVCRPEDVIARWGGDEFIIIFPKTNSKEAERIVKRIKASYADEYVNSVCVSISLGWNTKNKAEEDILSILKSAEDYMYKYKVIEQKSIRSNTINTIMSALFEKNPREKSHSVRVSKICEGIGKGLGYSENDISRIKLVGLLHDIGKIAIEEGILNKPGKLTETEMNEIKRHPDIGYRILGSSYDMSDLTECLLAHHERWDGMGYPRGLKGEAIPKVARIIAVADSFDAMTSDRPYRKALSMDEAVTEILGNSGTQFEPEAAKIFVEKVLAGL